MPYLRVSIHISDYFNELAVSYNNIYSQILSSRSVIIASRRNVYFLGMNKKGERDNSLPPLRDESKKISREDLLSEKSRQKLEREEEFMRDKAKKEMENKRNKRAAQQIYADDEFVVNLVITNDAHFFRIFKTWDGGVYTDEEALILMEEYILFTIGGIDHRMYNIRNLHPDVKLRVHLSAIMPVFDDQLSTDLNQWTVHPATGISNGLNADLALDSFSRFVSDNGYLMFGIDHVMAITGQDLVIEVSPGVWDSSIKGYTFIRAMCNQPLYSVSMVEFPSQGYISRYATHELAHSIGIFHDEGGAGCSPQEQFIMTDNLKPAMIEYASNPFLFSNCSVATLKAFLERVQTANAGLDPSLQCIRNNGVPDYEGLLQYRLAGKYYQIRTQCVYLMNDPKSIPCLPPHESYCYHVIYCTAAWDPGYCHTGYPYNGSPCNNVGQMFTCTTCMRVYGTQESLKRHIRYAHNDRVKCRWCPYDVSINAKYRLTQHEKTVHWYKFKDEKKEKKDEKKEKKDDHKVKSVVKKVKGNKENLPPVESTSKTQEKDDLPPLEEPMAIEFEELMSSCLMTPEENLLFSQPPRKIISIETNCNDLITVDGNQPDDVESEEMPMILAQDLEGMDETQKEGDTPSPSNRKVIPTMDEVVEVVEEIVEIERVEEIKEPDSVEERPSLTREVLVEALEEKVVTSETGDRRIVVDIDGMHPTPRYLPSRSKVERLPYGRTYDHRHYLCPDEKDEEDPRLVLMAPPSTYGLSEEAALLRRIRERARKQGVTTKTIPDGYQGLIKTERCELPDGTIYTISNHWVPEIPIRRQMTTGTQCNITPECVHAGTQVAPVCILMGTQTEEDTRVVQITETSNTMDMESQCDIIACRFY